MTQSYFDAPAENPEVFPARGLYRQPVVILCACCHDAEVFEDGEFCHFCAYEAMGGLELAESWYDAVRWPLVRDEVMRRHEQYLAKMAARQ